MSDSSIQSTRPLSPHLSIYRLIPTMVMSGLHRITGIALYFGMVLLAWWLIAAATGEAYFNLVNAVFGSWIGQLVLLGFTWSLVHHMFGGVRHLIWDTGRGLDKETSTKSAWATIIASVVVTILIWIVGYLVRG